MGRQGTQGRIENKEMSEEDEALCKLFGRMVPALKKGILRDAERLPDVMNLQVVLLASILQIRKELGCR